MNKVRLLGGIIFVLALGLLLCTIKVAKMFKGKGEEISRLSLEVSNITQKNNALKEELKEKEKKLTEVKESMEQELEEAEEEIESIKNRYETEREKVENLEKDLKEVRTTLEKEKKVRDELSAELEKIRKEKEYLARDLEEVRLAKEALQAFIAEGEGLAREEDIEESFVSSGRIITVYPQGLLAVELEESPIDEIKKGKIVKDGREIDVSKVYSHMVIFEVDEDEDLSILKKNDTIKYRR